MNINKIRSLINNILISGHAYDEMLNEEFGFIQVIEIKEALLNGEIIEHNPESKPYPSCLVLGWLKTGDPLHVKCSTGTIEPKLRIVTVYEPSDEEWKSDYKTRKRMRR